MKKRDVFIPSVTTLLLSSIIFFLSCASQNRVKDELDAQGEQTTTEEVANLSSENAPAEGMSQEELDKLAQAPEQLEGQVENAENAVNEAEQTAQVEGQKAQDDLAALGLDSTTPPADPNGTTSPMGADGLPQNSAGAVGGANGDAAAAGAQDVTTLGTEAGAAAGAGAIGGAIADSSTESNPPPESTPLDTTSIPSSPVLENEKPAPRHRSFYSGSSRVPKIPSKAVTRKGSVLNRFYFARKGDTPSRVSQLIYGNPDRAKDLKQWNGGTWAPGMLLFYKSPADPGDGEMHSFYQERNVTPEDYTVQRGDWLSKVAKNRLGAPGSWKEIAVINGMDKPDALEVGQRIALYPSDLSSYSGPQALAKAEEPPPQPEPIKAPEPVIAQAPPVTTQPIQAAPPVEAPVAEAPLKESVANAPALDSAKFLEQNALAILILGAALVLGLALVMRKKKSARTADDFSDDNFAPPTKLKRK